MRKPEYLATERQIRWFERYGVRLILPSHPEYPPRPKVQSINLSLAVELAV